MPSADFATPVSSRTFDPSVAALRGLAVLLMVSGHVIGDTPDRGLGLGEDSGWRWAYVFLSDVRMPLFTMLSGYVYAMRPLRPGAPTGHFLRRKAQRLLIPMVVVGLVYMTMQWLIPGTNERPTTNALIQLFFFGYQHLWFVPALALIFAFVAFLDTRPGVPDWSAPTWWLLVAGVLALEQLVTIPPAYNFFSLGNALGLLPFFLTGVAFRRYPVSQSGWAAALACLSCAALLTADIELRIHGYDNGHPGLDLVRVATAMSAMFALFLSRRIIAARWLGRIGEYSYGIYLWHVFFAAASRIVLTRAGIGALPVLFTTGLAFGIAGPILLELTLGATVVGARLAFGRRRPRAWLGR